MAGVESDISLDEVAGMIREFVKAKSRAPVMVGIPTRGVIDSEWLEFYWQHLKPYEHPGDVWRSLTGTTIGDQREALVKSFLEDTNYPFLVMIDDDTVYMGNGDPFQQMQEVMLETGAGIVTGVTPLGVRPHSPNVYLYRNPDGTKSEEGWYRKVTEFDRGLVMDVDACGGAFLMVSRRVLETLEPPRFGHSTELGLSEDLYFCHKARQAGFKIVADFRIPLGHIKKIAYTLEHFVNARAAAGGIDDFAARRAEIAQKMSENARNGDVAPYLHEGDGLVACAVCGQTTAKPVFDANGGCPVCKPPRVNDSAPKLVIATH